MHWVDLFTKILTKNNFYFSKVSTNFYEFETITKFENRI
jgi:hypothetical protein